MILGVKKSFTEIKTSVRFKDEVVENIIGNSKKVKDLYLDETLNVGLLVGCEGYHIRAIGRPYSKPNKLIKLFKYMIEAFNLSKNDLSFFSIGYFGSRKILVDIKSGDKVTTIFLDKIDDRLVLDSEDSLFLEEGSKTEIEKQVSDVINWANTVIPVPVFNIQYHFCREGNSINTLGTGRVFIGLAEAHYSNGVYLVNEENVKPGEYSVILLEDN